MRRRDASSARSPIGDRGAGYDGSRWQRSCRAKRSVKIIQQWVHGRKARVRSLLVVALYEHDLYGKHMTSR